MVCQPISKPSSGLVEAANDILSKSNGLRMLTDEPVSGMVRELDGQIIVRDCNRAAPAGRVVPPFDC